MHLSKMAILATAVVCGTTAGAHDLRGNTKQKTVLETTTSTGSVLDKPVARAVVNQYKLWDTGMKLQICFMGGEIAGRQFIRKTANEWLQRAKLSFDFGDEPSLRNCDVNRPSHIRIAFLDDGNWSYVGNDALKVKGGYASPSMNFGELATKPFHLIPEDFLKGLVLHEFGHALALEHEHQSKNSKCVDEMDWNAVYDAMKQPPNAWDKDYVDKQFRPLVDAERLRSTKYEKTSIMHYAFPANWFKAEAQERCWVARNDELADSDREEIAKAYPATLKEQQSYLLGLDKRSSVALAAAGASQGLKEQLQLLVNAGLSEGLKRSGVQSNFLIVKPITVNSTQNSSAGCSPNIVVAGEGNAVTITSDCR